MNLDIVGIVALISLILSGFSFFHTKLITRIEFLTNKRYDWLSKVREHFDSFIFMAVQMQIYEPVLEESSSIISNRNKIIQMRELQNKISLLMNVNGKYESLIDILMYRIIALSSKKIDFSQMYFLLSDCEKELGCTEFRDKIWKNYINIRVYLIEESLKETDKFIRCILDHSKDNNTEKEDGFKDAKNNLVKILYSKYLICNLELNIYVIFLTVLVKILLKVEWNRIKEEMKKLGDTSPVDSDDIKFDFLKKYLNSNGKIILNSKQSEQEKAIINNAKRTFVNNVNDIYDTYVRKENDNRRNHENDKKFFKEKIFEEVKKYYSINSSHNIGIVMILNAIESFENDGKIFENSSELNNCNRTYEINDQTILAALDENEIADELINAFKHL